MGEWTVTPWSVRTDTRLYRYYDVIVRKLARWYKGGVDQDEYMEYDAFVPVHSVNEKEFWSENSGQGTYLRVLALVGYCLGKIIVSVWNYGVVFRSVYIGT
jgi:hypothetical protein